MIDFKLYLITDRTLTGYRTLYDVIDEACGAGVRAVQLRERDLDPLQLFNYAKQIRSVTKKYNARLFINDRIDIALAVDAEGVQLRETSVPVAEAKKLLSGDKLIGVSVHSIDKALQAQKEGADFLVFGTVFKTRSKPELREPSGTKQITELTSKVTIPVFAVGGITPARSRKCIDAGAHGVAVISSIMKSDNIPLTIDQYKEHLRTL